MLQFMQINRKKKKSDKTKACLSLNEVNTWTRFGNEVERNSAGAISTNFTEHAQFLL